jgi:hypothetical protein
MSENDALILAVIGVAGVGLVLYASDRASHRDIQEDMLGGPDGRKKIPNAKDILPALLKGGPQGALGKIAELSVYSIGNLGKGARNVEKIQKVVRGDGNPSAASQVLNRVTSAATPWTWFSGSVFSKANINRLRAKARAKKRK